MLHGLVIRCILGASPVNPSLSQSRQPQLQCTHSIRGAFSPRCYATIKMRSAELTGVGESVQVRRAGKVNHYCHREPCARTREGVSEASVAARVDGMIEHRKCYGLECRGFLIGRRQDRRNRNGEGLPDSALSKESMDARTPLAGTREGFNSPRQSSQGRRRLRR